MLKKKQLWNKGQAGEINTEISVEFLWGKQEEMWQTLTPIFHILQGPVVYRKLSKTVMEMK